MFIARSDHLLCGFRQGSFMIAGRVALAHARNAIFRPCRQCAAGILAGVGAPRSKGRVLLCTSPCPGREGGQAAPKAWLTITAKH
jgi:hypothetical protein